MILGDFLIEKGREPEPEPRHAHWGYGHRKHVVQAPKQTITQWAGGREKSSSTLA